MFDANTLLSVRSQVDLYIVACDMGLSLKSEGNIWRGLCPFHTERTPSFTIGKGKSFYKCYGCGASGDAISLVRHIKGCDFVEAVEFLADKFNIPVRYEGKNYQSIEQCSINSITRIASEATHNLCYNDKADLCRQYLHKRQLSTETIKFFGLGFVASLSELTGLNNKDYKSLRDIGILNKGNQLSLTGRLLFPMTNSSGTVLGFSGRMIPGIPCYRSGKYINTVDSAVYNKAKAMFCFHLIKPWIMKSKSVVLVEGFFDFIRCFEAGTKNLLCLQGTSIPDVWIDMLYNWDVTTAVVLFDGDAAGYKAAVQVGQRMLAKMIDVRVVRLEHGEDPDSFILQYGKEELHNRINTAMPLMHFWAEHLLELSHNNMGLRWRVFRSAINSILAIPSPHVGRDKGFLEHFCRAAHIEFKDIESLKQQWKLEPAHKAKTDPKTSELDQILDTADKKTVSVVERVIKEILYIGITSSDHIKVLFETNHNLVRLWYGVGNLRFVLNSMFADLWHQFPDFIAGNGNFIDAERLDVVMNTEAVEHDFTDKLLSLVRFCSVCLLNIVRQKGALTDPEKEFLNQVSMLK